MGATILGSGVNITTGAAITTTPPTTPITILSTGMYADSYWDLSTTTLVPVNSAYKVGLGTVDTDTVTDNYMLLYDTVTNEIKKIDAEEIELKADTRAWSTITSTPTTLSGYGITDNLQPLDADLTAIAALSSNGFLKKTTGTWGMDTNTYSTTSHTHPEYVYTLTAATESTLGGIKVGNSLEISSGVLNVKSGGGGAVLWGYIDGTLSSQTDLVEALALKAPLDAPVFTSSFGFAATGWRIYPDSTSLLLKYNGTTKATLESDGDISFVGDVVAYAT
jgi:hypothetical protein